MHAILEFIREDLDVGAELPTDRACLVLAAKGYAIAVGIILAFAILWALVAPAQ